MLPLLHDPKTNVANYSSATTNKKFKHAGSWLVMLSSLFGVGVQGQSIVVTNVSPAPICAGSPITITFSTTNGNGGNNHYDNSAVYTVLLSNSSGTSFTPIGSTFSTSGVTYSGSNGGVTSNITHVVTIPGTSVSGTGYKISMTSTAPLFTGGSTGTGASLAFAISAPPTTANAGPDQTGDATCGQTTVSLAANTPTSGAGSWSIASTSPNTDGTFGSASSATSTFIGVAGKTYILRWTISNSPCAPSSDDVIVTFNTLPTDAAAGPNQRACGVTTTNLAAIPPEFGTGAWSFAPGNTGIGGSFGDPSSPSSSFSGVENQLYILRWTVSTPCASTTDNVQITFDPELSSPPVLTLTKEDASSCHDDGIIKGFASEGSGDYTFTFSGTGTETPIPPDGVMFSGLAPDHYTLQARDNENGCTALKDTTIIRLDPPFIEVSTKGNVSACSAGNGFFTLRVFPRTGTIATGLKPFSFQLTPPEGSFKPEISAPFKFSSLPEGTYQVVMTDSAGCISNTLKNIVIGKDEPLALELSGWGNPTTCGGNNGDITVKAINGSHSTYRYRISTDGITYGPEQSGRRFGGLTAGTYTVQGRDSRGCTATLMRTLNDPKGCIIGMAGSTDHLNLMDKNSLTLQVVPNPTKTAFILNLQNDSQQKVQIIVTDMFGKKLYQATGSSNQPYTFGQEFASGMYIIQVIQGKQVQTLKLVKEN